MLPSSIIGSIYSEICLPLLQDENFEWNPIYH